MADWGNSFTNKAPSEVPEGKSELTAESDRVPIREKISNMRKKLNLWEGFKFDLATDREISRVAGELAINQLNGEKEVAIDLIINNVALGKRANLRDYLVSVSVTDSEILQIGEETKKKLSYTMQSEITQIVKDKKMWKAESKALLDNGEIEPQDYESLLLMHEGEALELIQSKRDDRNTVRETYAKRLGQALQGYVERHPDYSKL